MPLSRGDKLGPYEILAPIGAGGMGEVYKARDTRLNRVVAIKILPEHLSKTPQFTERFEREARVIARLNHPHICAVYDVGHQDGIEYLVMEYLVGHPLRGPLPLEETLRAGQEIAESLDAAHRKGVVHRDLKPGNILMTKSGVKLLDFGLAKAQAVESAEAGTALLTLTRAGEILGTPQYMAPEQVEGKEADARSDIFAFGAILYEMITGRTAFQGGTWASVMAAIIREDPPPISDVLPAGAVPPPALARLVMRCLAKDPDDRWQTAQDLAEALKLISQTSGAPGTVVSKQHVKALTIAAGVIAAGLTLLVLAAGVGQLSTWWSGAESYKVYLVGNRSDPEHQSIVTEFMAAKGDAVLKINGVPVRFEERDDRGDPAAAQEVASALAIEEDALMVIGHFVSSQTKAALPSYLRAQPPIPVLLTTETSPDLLPPQTSSQEYHPVLRLSPTDDMQAAEAVRYAVRKGASAFWVLEDSSNAVYSRFLAQEFVRRVEDERRAVVLWTSHLTPPSPETLKALKIDCVLFAGTSSQALMLVRQIRAFYQANRMTMPMIMLTDAVVDRRLLQQGQGILEGVNVTYPMLAKDYQTQGARAYGRTAYAITEELIRESGKRFQAIRREGSPAGYWMKSLLNMRDVRDARAVLTFLMLRAVTSEQKFHTGGVSYKFKYNGRTEGPLFHVWQVRDGSFIDAN